MQMNFDIYFFLFQVHTKLQHINIPFLIVYKNHIYICIRKIMANRQNVRAQSMLITLILLLGIRMVTPCKFVDLIEPDDEGRGWRVKVDPAEEFLDTYEFR